MCGHVVTVLLIIELRTSPRLGSEASLSALSFHILLCVRSPVAYIQCILSNISIFFTCIYSLLFLHWHGQMGSFLFHKGCYNHGGLLPHLFCMSCSKLVCPTLLIPRLLLRSQHCTFVILTSQLWNKQGRLHLLVVLASRGFTFARFCRRSLSRSLFCGRSRKCWTRRGVLEDHVSIESDACVSSGESTERFSTY